MRASELLYGVVCAIRDQYLRVLRLLLQRQDRDVLVLVAVAVVNDVEETNQHLSSIGRVQSTSQFDQTKQSKQRDHFSIDHDCDDDGEKQQQKKKKAKKAAASAKAKTKAKKAMAAEEEGEEHTDDNEENGEE